MEIPYSSSFLNYTGGKHKILPQLLPLFPEKCTRFVDLFCGSGTVAFNQAKLRQDKNAKFALNDTNEPVIGIMRALKDISVQSFLDFADEIIAKYKLSNTFEYGYKYYGANSSAGLAHINKANYYALRDDYNTGVFEDHEKSIALYVLIVFSFNNQIRFNRHNEFNLPVGKRDLNSSMRKKLVNIGSILHDYDFSFFTQDFVFFKFERGDFVYCDPPYLLGNATYNENGLWTEYHEERLLEMLDGLNDIGLKFALSNVLKHKGNENHVLKVWSEKYRVKYIEANYNNSNYQSAARHDETQEVLILNY